MGFKENLQFKNETLCFNNEVILNCRFEECRFDETKFWNAKFTDCVFKSCNLHLVKLEGSRLQNVIFEKCKIVAADFNLCDKKFFSIQFDQCVLMGCNFSGLNMKKTHFGKSKSTENFFNETQLQEANFCGCDLLGSVFHHANLSKADFTGAVNYAIDPRSNVLKDAAFSLPEAVSLLNFLEIKIS